MQSPARSVHDDLGVTLESDLLAQREIAEGLLVAPLIIKARNIRSVNHTLVLPVTAKTRRPLRLFIAWLGREMGIDLAQGLA